MLAQPIEFSGADSPKVGCIGKTTYQASEMQSYRCEHRPAFPCFTLVCIHKGHISREIPSEAAVKDQDGVAPPSHACL